MASRHGALVRVVGALSAVALVTSCAGAPEQDAATASGGGYPATVSSCGLKTKVAKKPRRAVTVHQGATEVMLALGLEDRMAATAGLDDAVSPRWADAYKKVDVISDTDQAPTREKLLSLKADFVYASYISAFEKEAAGPRDELQKMGVAAYVSPFSCGTPEKSKPATFDNVWAEVRDIATLFGVKGRAEKFIGAEKKKVAAIEDEQAGKDLSIFWYDSGDKTPYVGVGTGAPQLIIDTVGGANPFSKVKGNWADISWERVLKADPDVIVLADASWSTAKEKIAYLRKDPALRTMRAVRENRFVTLPFSETTPGVRVVEGAQTVSEQLKKLDIGS